MDGDRGAAVGRGAARRVAPRRATSLTLTMGTLVGAACFAIALAADVAGRDGGRADGIPDPAGVLGALTTLDPWAWAALGSAVIIVTPALGLVVTAVEFLMVADRPAALLAVAVLAVLGLSLAVALVS